MPILDGITLPREIVTEMLKMCERVPGDELEVLVAMYPELSKGGARKAERIEHARTKLARLVESEGELDPTARSLVAGSSLYQRFLIVMSEEAIEASWSMLSAWFGEARLLTAALLDARPRVRAIAAAALKTRGDRAWAPADPSAGKALAEFFSPFLTELGKIVLPRAEAAQSSARSVEHEREIDELKRRLEVTERRLLKREEESRRIGEERDRVAEEMKTLAAKLRSSDEARRLTEEKFTADLERAVESEMRSRLSSYLGPIVQRGETANSNSAQRPPDLAARAALLHAASGEPEEPAFLRRLRAAAAGMNAAQIEGMKRFIAEALRLGCLSEEERAAIDAQLRRHVAALADPLLAGRSDADDVAPEAKRLLLALDGKTRLLVVIDGHNVCRTELVRRMHPDADDAELRQELVRRVTSAFKSAGKIECRLFFDGPVASFESGSPNVVIEFSGGAAAMADRADGSIERFIAHRAKTESSVPILVVSADRGVQSSARRLRAQFMLPFEFVEML